MNPTHCLKDEKKAKKFGQHIKSDGKRYHDEVQLTTGCGAHVRKIIHETWVTRTVVNKGCISHPSCAFGACFHKRTPLDVEMFEERYHVGYTLVGDLRLQHPVPVPETVGPCR
jgi:hypothetical protein